MTYLPLVLLIVLIGATACSTFLLARSAPELLARARRVVGARRERRRTAIHSDPVDYILAFVSQRRPRILRLQQAVASAQTGLDDAEDRERHVVSTFPEGDPTLRRIILTHIVFAVWVISLIGEALIAFPVVIAASGGNVLAGVLGTLVTLTVPVLCSLGLAHVVGRRDRWNPALTSLAVTGILVAFVSIVAILTSLAPVRAEMEVHDERRLAEQRLEEYTEDGDEVAARYAQRALDDLDTREAQATAWNSALIPIAMCAELASGFALPGTIALWRLRAARSRKETAKGRVTKAQDRLAVRNANEQRVLSARMQDAGVTQDMLQRPAALAVAPAAVAAPAGTAGPDAPPAATGRGEVIVTAEVAPAQASRTPVVPPPAAPAPDRPTSPARAPRSEPAPRPTPEPRPAPAPSTSATPDPGFDLS